MVDSKRTKLRKSRYLVAFVITLFVFALGWLLGMIMDSQRVQYMSDEAELQKVEYNSLQLQYQLLEEISKEEECTAILTTFESSVKNLETARARLETYQTDATINEDEFALLTREYSLAQTRYYLLAKKTQEICDNDIVTILYFYSTEEECPQCEDQAFVLTYLKKLLDDKVLVFSFNANLAEAEPTIGMLMDFYGVNTYPSIVINGETYDHLVLRDEALEKICSYYQEDIAYCD